jgi:hypothetical protein
MAYDNLQACATTFVVRPGCLIHRRGDGMGMNQLKSLSEQISDVHDKDQNQRQGHCVRLRELT